MQTVKIPLASELYSHIDGSVLNDKAAVNYNGFVDELGGINVRPALKRQLALSYKPIGAYVLPGTPSLVVPQNGYIGLYTINSDGSLTQVAVNASTNPAGTKASVCHDGTYAFIASGGKINYINSAGAVTEMADADAPTAVTHVAYLDGYILATNSNNRFHWSDVLASTTWDSLSFATAAGAPDYISALHLLERQAYLFGAISIEIWENDGNTPFSRIPGGYLETGISSAYGIARMDSSFIFLSHMRYFMEIARGRLERIGSPFDKDIKEMLTVSDCVADRVESKDETYVVFSFPTEGRTFAYEISTKQWAEWATWRSELMEWQSLDFFGASYSPTCGKTYVIGERSDSVFTFETSEREDELTINGSNTDVPVKFLRRSGHIDFGTSKMKRPGYLRFRASRGDSSGPGTLMLRWRKDGLSDWSNIREIDLGSSGDTKIVVQIPPIGIFKTIQFELSVTDAVPIVISDAEMEIEVLRS